MPDPSKDITDQQFPVVGIGASAGGLEAIKLFLTGVPAKTGMAYVYVQHLSPNHESALTEILSRGANIPVVEITDDVYLEPDKFFIIPSNKMLSAVDGKLKLYPRNEKTKKIKTIDHFFSSLGVVHQSFAVGVVLSGTLDDGTLGLQVIKANGGITFVQDDTAAYGGMPGNAIKAGTADFVLPPDKIADKLIEINKPFHENEAEPDFNHPIPQKEEEIFRQILSTLRSKKKVDFTHYKQTTIVRRIQRRMALKNCEKPLDYLNALRESPSEQEALFKDMLISVTDFFRDPNTFEVLRNKIIPALLDTKPENETIRVWVAGCATGEEAYSIAICFEEYLSTVLRGKVWEGKKVQIFATDISESAIAKARTGIYTKSDLKMVSANRLERFFTKLDGSFQVNKSIRECCVFAQHNLLKDPPFSKMSVVSCRNLLIYLEPILQKKALAIFHYALTEKGNLILGKSETVGSASELFTPINNQEKIYIKKGTTGRFMHVTSAGKELAMQNENIPPSKYVVTDVNKKVEEILLLNYTPAGVLVNESFDIIQFRGTTDPWLTPPHGKASLNLMKMAREGLSFELRNILHLAKSKNAAARKEGIVMQVNGKRQIVNIEAIPVSDAIGLHFLVLFQNALTHSMVGEETDINFANGSEKKSPLVTRIEQLEKELAQNREDMRAITEDQEATNEELQSANEELLSGSEELQALNEELETAKEELQSTNEELRSLNHELLDRFEQLNKSQKFTEGVFATIRDPLIVLNHEFKITKATEGFYKKFGLTEKQTEGKILFDLLDHGWNIPDLKQYLENISPENSSLTDFEITKVFSSIGQRNLILNVRQLERIDGHKMILLAIEDITDKKKAEQSNTALVKSNEDLQHSNLELEQFAGIASHDLQEPLRKILTFANIIHNRDLEVSEAAKLYITKIEDAAIRMQSIIRDLLSYSKIIDVKESFVPVNLNDVLKNIVHDFELAVEEKSAQINVREMPVIIGNPVYMNQLFYNLINNALKFSKKNTPPIIDVYSKMLDSDERDKHPDLSPHLDYVEIIVNDNGIGFDQMYADQIFDLFQRLNGRDEYPGTGIGLALCRKIVLQHGGNIYVQSKEGVGTSFHILLSKNH